MIQVFHTTVANEDLEVALQALESYGYNRDDAAVTTQKASYTTQIGVECMAAEEFYNVRFCLTAHSATLEALCTKYGVLVNVTRSETQEKVFNIVYNELSRRLI